MIPILSSALESNDSFRSPEGKKTMSDDFYNQSATRQSNIQNSKSKVAELRKKF